MELTSKEKSLLNDCLSCTQLCSTKYETYANQTNDPEIKGLFNTIKESDQKHVQTITSILQQGGF